MKYSLRTRHLTLSDTDHDLLFKKMERLEKFVSTPFHTDINLSHITHHNKGAVYECKINIEHSNRNFYASRTNDTIQDAIDDATHALRRELTKYKDINSRKR